MSKKIQSLVLVVEDDPSWQQILHELLSDAGLEVETVDNLDTALKSIHETHHHLMIVDLSLNSSDHHNRDGLRILDACHQYDPNCIAILLTGYATVELAVSVLTQYGAFTCLRKETFQRAEFRQLIQNALTTAIPWSNAGQNQSTSPSSDNNIDSVDLSAPEQSKGVAIVIDDDAGWRSILSELLIETGYQVRLCSSFGEALGCLGREHFNLAIIDLSLANNGNLSGFQTLANKPGDENTQILDGYRLLGYTRASGIPAIVITGFASPRDIEFIYKEYEVFTCLEKQAFSRQAFLNAIREIQVSQQNINSELDILSKRERQVLALVAKGMTNKDIADVLVITTNTVKRHLKAIFEKLNVHTRSAAAARWRKNK